MKLRASVYLLAATLLILCASAAQATKILHLDPAQLAAEASAVVRGTVTGVESFKNASGTKIYTETLIAVDESYKGDPGSEVRLVQLGGVVDGVQVTVHGALHWTQGEEVVVFLEPYEGGRFHVAGFSQGKFLVERNPQTGRPFILRQALVDVDLVDDNGQKHTHQGEVDRVPLDQFLSGALGADYVPRNR